MIFNNLASYLAEHAFSTQFFIYAAIMIGMWVWEKIATGEAAAEKWRHSAQNGIFVLTALPIQIVMMQLCMALADYVARHHWGLVHLFADAENPWIKYGAMFVFLDFLDYVYHLAMHKLPLFWRFHRLHHTEQRLDVSTTVREHPGETFIRNCFLILWVLICGASIEVLILRQSLESLANILAHTSFRLPAPWARIVAYVFVTPNFHHVHHHFQRPATNRNYGDVFTLWDRAFGTFFELSREETIFGLDRQESRNSPLRPAILAWRTASELA